ncbi:HSP20-like chaperone [Phyllosticta citribraziliensis]|uniref:HSP20-like chaperone n=1 Tax=Phyllosticta citribraziliensis TaxID=989973 RepID=A0ABR1LNN9_9PEZI
MSQTLTPEVLWAQRSSTTDVARNIVYVAISAPDVPKDKMKLDIQPTKITFSGHSDTKSVDYAVELELYAEVDPKESKVNHTGKNVELVLRKAELAAEYWPRLLKESKRQHFLKTDFDKWVDEDEQDENVEDDYLSQMGGAGGMPGGGMPGGGDFGGIDFSKLGAAAGGDGADLSGLMGGMGGGMGGIPGMGAMGGAAGGEDDGDDDDDMPELEGEEEGEAAKKADAPKKVEEVA